MTDRVYDKAFDLLMINEGGYVNNPHDKGGETKYGISKKAYPDLDIAALTLAEAKSIYYADYWLRAKCDKLPDALSVAVFDYAVNSGIKRAIKDMQKVLGVTIDGIIGNQTIGASIRKPLKQTIEKYIEERQNFVTSLKDFAHFGKGWAARIKRVKGVCETLCG